MIDTEYQDTPVCPHCGWSHADACTPETDAFRDSQFTDRVDEMEKLYDLAEKLERKRDEARESWYEMQSSFERSRDEVEELIRERDFALGELGATIVERNEARERERIAALVHKALYDTVERERDETTQERDGALALLALTEEFLAILGDELHETAMIATLHGWKSRRYEQGNILREKIKQLKEKSKLTK